MLFNEFFNEYPYRDIESTNLDFMIKEIQRLNELLNHFVSLNTIEYANPLQWSINRQYKKNVIVVDPTTGVAYISNSPVPVGVPISNTNYWSVIFDVGRFITLAASNFANSYERDLTTTATMPTNAGKWVVWQSELYKAKNDIHIGDRYVIDGNIERYTVEMFFDELFASINTERSERREGDDNLLSAILEEVEARETADTNEQTAREHADELLQNAIGTEIDNRQTADGNLSALTTNDKSNLVAAINEVNNTGGGAIAKIGNLSNLLTSTKSNIVSAINETFTINDYQDVVGVKEFGAKCDGITDDSDALINAINSCENKVLVINGDMKISKPIPITHPIIIRGNSHIIYTASTFSTTGGLVGERQVFAINNATRVKIENLTIDSTNTNNINSGIIINEASRVEIEGVNFINIFGTALWIRTGVQYARIINCYANNCDQSPRLNGGGAFHIATGTSGTANFDISFIDCTAESCGNAGFCAYNSNRVLMHGCKAIDMQGGSQGRDWEVGDGFMTGSGTIISNCYAENIMNAAYYVTGDRNIIIGCTASNCKGMALDLYTGTQTGYDNTVIGLTANNCGTYGHTDMYQYTSIISGTHQYRLLMSDINIVGGGGTNAQTIVIGMEAPAECIFNNIHMVDISNIAYGISFGGAQNGNIIQNSKILGTISMEQYSQYSHFSNLNTNETFVTITLTNGDWNNHTHHDVMAYIDAIGSTVYVNNQSVGGATCVYVPHNGKLGVTGGTINSIKIIKL